LPESSLDINRASIIPEVAAGPLLAAVGAHTSHLLAVNLPASRMAKLLKLTVKRLSVVADFPKILDFCFSGAWVYFWVFDLGGFCRPCRSTVIQGYR
jgi:hypothetical protein